MSVSKALLDLTAGLMPRRPRPPATPSHARILVIRRNRLGDMIYTLPLLHALRAHLPQAHITVACDPLGASIARACEAVNDVLILEPGWNRWHAAFKNASRLQDYDITIAAKGGVDRRLGALTRLTNAPVRIGFEESPGPSSYYTESVPLPDDPYHEHQIDTLLRLLAPIQIPIPSPPDISIRVPEPSRTFAAEILGKSPFANSRFMLMNISSTAPLKFREEDFAEIAARVFSGGDLAIGIVSTPADQPKARALAARINSDRAVAIATPGPLDLAALLERASFLLTPEGGAAHLAATVDCPALVLWSEGPFEKWHSRGRDHAYIRSNRHEPLIPVDRVWSALEPFFAFK